MVWQHLPVLCRRVLRVALHPWYEGGWYGSTCLYYAGGCCELRYILGMREDGMAAHACTCIMQEGVASCDTSLVWRHMRIMWKEGFGPHSLYEGA